MAGSIPVTTRTRRSGSGQRSGTTAAVSASQPGKQGTGEHVVTRDPAVPEAVPDRQHPHAGDIIADGPSGTAYYVVHQAEPDISLVLFTDTHLRCLLPARVRDS